MMEASRGVAAAEAAEAGTTVDASRLRADELWAVASTKQAECVSVLRHCVCRSASCFRFPWAMGNGNPEIFAPTRPSTSALTLIRSEFFGLRADDHPSVSAFHD